MPPAKKPVKKAPAKKPEPSLDEVNVSYSIGVKCNMDRFENGKRVNTYESSDYHFSKSERWNVKGMSEAAVAEFTDERYEALKEELDGKAMEVYAETSFFAQDG